MTNFISPNHKAVFGLTLAVLVLAGATLWVGLTSPVKDKDDNVADDDQSQIISNFKECEQAGYPIMESYPRQCRVPGGELFVEEIGTVGEFFGSISGSVMLGPTCPVEREPPDPNCADRPYSHSGKFNVIKTSTEQIVQTFNSNALGKFFVEVPVGEYIIRRASNVNIFPHCDDTGVIKVMANSDTDTVISCDTGIR